MKRIWSAAALAATVFMAAALPAAADNYPIRDGTGASQTFCSKLVGGLQYPCHLLYGMFGSAPTPVTMDGSNLNVHVQASELPTGAASAANQATGNTSLSQIITLETSLNTVLGAQGDATWSGTGSGTAIAIQKYIAAKAEASRALLAGTLTVQFPSAQAVTQSGTWNLTNITGTVSLPTGASTAVNQTAPQATPGSDATKAIAVQGVTGGKPIPTTSTPTPTASTTDRSVTITTGGTAQQVMAANTSRRSFYVFNPNASDGCWASLTNTTPAANAAGSFALPAQGAFGMEVSPTTNAFWVNCPTTGDKITAWESQ